MKFRINHSRHIQPKGPPDKNGVVPTRTFNTGDVIEAQGEEAHMMSQDAHKFTQLSEDGGPRADILALQAVQDENARLREENERLKAVAARDQYPHSHQQQPQQPPTDDGVANVEGKAGQHHASSQRKKTDPRYATLEQMNVKDLQAFALEEGIDLKGVGNGKNEIVNAIKKA